MISNSKISIAMAAYNAEKYIFDQLISIENQTLKPSEIIICNDASTDQTKEIIEDFQKKSNIFIRIIDHKKNLGYHKAFETAVKNCSGNYIFISDSDDVWFNNKIKETINIFQNNLHINLIINNSEFTDENLKSNKISKIENYLKINKNLNFYIPGCNCAFRKKILDLYLPFPHYFIAYDYWLNKISIISNTRLINYNILQYYRRHGSNNSINDINNLKYNKFDLNKINQKVNFYNFIRLNIELKKRLLKKNLDFNLEIIISNIEKENRSYLLRNKISKSNIIEKFFLILVMIKNNYYFKYFNGFKSIIKDIIK